MHSRVFEGLRADPTQLTAAEAALLAVSGFGPARRDEWIRGRLAVRRLLAGVPGAPVRASVLSAPTGAPRLVGDGEGWTVSISHDGRHVAVAARAPAPDAGAVAIDVCSGASVTRAARLVARIGDPGDVDPTVAWVAFEVAVKLRERSLLSLLDAPASARRIAGGAVRVIGVGDPVDVAIARGRDYVVGLACT